MAQENRFLTVGRFRDPFSNGVFDTVAPLDFGIRIAVYIAAR